jgi:hypothetical protein
MAVQINRDEATDHPVKAHLGNVRRHRLHRPRGVRWGGREPIMTRLDMSELTRRKAVKTAAIAGAAAAGVAAASTTTHAAAQQGSRKVYAPYPQIAELFRRNTEGRNLDHEQKTNNFRAVQQAVTWWVEEYQRDYVGGFWTGNAAEGSWIIVLVR